MALAVCLLFDERADRAMRRLWDRLEELDIPTLRSHTHGRHVPHLSYAVLREWDLEKVRDRIEDLPSGDPVDLHFDALATFRRGRSWLVAAVGSELMARQERVVEAATDAGAEMHRNYVPGMWVPHCTVAPRVHLSALPAVAAAVYDVLPLHARADHAALVDSGTGRLWPLTNLP